VLVVLTEQQFVSLMTTIGRPDALLDPRFKDWAARMEHVALLREVIEGAQTGDDPKTWETRLRGR
jgi:crotonobetainyl-CoA:carnitine CoA-transferase CaiB-like acyl-CoA transferase